jgi:hypothetical protein
MSVDRNKGTLKMKGIILMGRKLKDDSVIVAQWNNRNVAWVNGAFAGDAELLTLVRESIAQETVIWLGKQVTASANTQEGALAALLSVQGMYVVTAPRELLTLVALRSAALRVSHV